MNTPRVNFIASIQEDRIDEINDIAEKLKGMGCKIDNILPLSGVITGNALQDLSLDDLKIDGIKNVEIDRDIKAI